MLRVLVVEDDPLFRKLVREQLGAQLELVECGALKQAQEMLGQELFDCAVVDLALPDGDGLTLLQAQPGLPIVFLTGSPDPRNLALVIQAGGEDFLTKSIPVPALGSELLQAIRKAIMRFGRRSSLRGGFLSAPELDLSEAFLEVGDDGLIRSAGGAVRLLLGTLQPEGLALARFLPDYSVQVGRCEALCQPVGGQAYPAEITATRMAGRWVLLLRNLVEDRRLLDALFNATENERQRLGQELHDNLGQRLAGMSYVAASLARVLPPDQEPGRLAGRLVALLQETIGETRLLAQGLFPTELERSGLITALERLCAELEQVYAVKCETKLNECGLPSGRPSLHVYRIVQEAIHNSVRHGEARRIQVHLTRQHGRVELCISDDGTGLEPGQLPRVGLISIRHHCLALGGTLELTPNHPTGMVLRCLLPA